MIITSLLGRCWLGSLAKVEECRGEKENNRLTSHHLETSLGRTLNNEDGLGSVKVVRRRTTLNQYIENWPQSRCMAIVCERNRSQLNTDADQDLRRVAGVSDRGLIKSFPPKEEC